MNCNVIRDLIPLYLDECCSEESRLLVEEHTAQCADCKALLEEVKLPLAQEAAPTPPMQRVSIFKASLMQSILFFLYFGIITLGVSLEAATGFGSGNGFWALNLVIPATGFLLALINWYFLRLYPSRRSFEIASLSATAAATLVCILWGMVHYEHPMAALGTIFFGWHSPVGFVFILINLLLSFLLSRSYATLLGKE